MREWVKCKSDVNDWVIVKARSWFKGIRGGLSFNNWDIFFRLGTMKCDLFNSGLHDDDDDEQKHVLTDLNSLTEDLVCTNGLALKLACILVEWY